MQSLKTLKSENRFSREGILPQGYSVKSCLSFQATGLSHRFRLVSSYEMQEPIPSNLNLSLSLLLVLFLWRHPRTICPLSCPVQSSSRDPELKVLKLAQQEASQGPFSILIGQFPGYIGRYLF